MACTRFLISGRVQGVFFRQSVVDEATRLGLRGYAKNLSDGRVEVLACGEVGLLAQLEAWLHQGPPMASVSGIEKMQVNEESIKGFTVRY
ncbi:MAG TPA: acylphosphatase [Chromatiales bacterium]|nr:acylphosphatase [Thiotrichales bacterium]HIP68183.1 acylphosphatase [Chromatiales bacterium]